MVISGNATLVDGAVSLALDCLPGDLPGDLPIDLMDIATGVIFLDGEVDVLDD